MEQSLQGYAKCLAELKRLLGTHTLLHID